MTRMLVLAIAAVLAGCDGAPQAASGAPEAAAACAAQPGAPGVPTMAFRDFLATRPTPADFRARYPRITLVMPGDVATREMRLDCSRFFADVDSEGHVSGGRFG